MSLQELEEANIRRAIKYGLADAMQDELKPLIEQHTRRMMVATLIANERGIGVDLIKKAVVTVDVIMAETE